MLGANVRMHIEHKAGEKLYVDYSGKTVPSWIEKLLNARSSECPGVSLWSTQYLIVSP